MKLQIKQLRSKIAGSVAGYISIELAKHISIRKVRLLGFCPCCRPLYPGAEDELDINFIIDDPGPLPNRETRQILQIINPVDRRS